MEDSDIKYVLDQEPLGTDEDHDQREYTWASVSLARRFLSMATMVSSQLMFLSKVKVNNFSTLALYLLEECILFKVG